MHFTRQSLTTLIDLVENKLSMMEVWDRDDRREAHMLRSCLEELQAARAHGGSIPGFVNPVPRRGRRRKVALAAH